MAASVVWIYANEDKSLATELMRFSGVLETQGIIRNWSMDHILPGQPWRDVLKTYLNGADVIMLLVSPALIADHLELWQQAYRASLTSERIRLVPVFLRAALLPPDLKPLQALPRGEKPLMAWRDRDAGIFEIIKALQELVQFRSTPPNDTSAVATNSPPNDSSAVASTPPPKNDLGAKTEPRLEEPQSAEPSKASRPTAKNPAVDEVDSSPATIILHLSDLHFNGDKDQVELIYGQLADDLEAQNVVRLDAVIITGDLVDAAKTEEYDAAEFFLEHLMKGFCLEPGGLAIVPGNHDINWETSKAAYMMNTEGKDPNTHFVSNEEIKVHNDHLYEKRLSNFAQFYRKVKGEEYSLTTKKQFTVTELSEHGVCVLGLNSAWETDHQFKDRASINPFALNAGLGLCKGKRRLKIAIFHHPIDGPEASRIKEIEFLDRLVLHNFHLVLHGHIHETRTQRYDLDQVDQGRRLRLVSGGTFGAPRKSWAPGFARQYNLLRLEGNQLSVSARCQEKVNGIWKPDSRWSRGPDQDRASTFTFDLS